MYREPDKYEIIPAVKTEQSTYEFFLLYFEEYKMIQEKARQDADFLKIEKVRAKAISIFILVCIGGWMLWLILY